MTSLLIDGLLIMLLLYAIRVAKDFQGKYEEVKELKNELKGLMRQVQSSMNVASKAVDEMKKNIHFAATHVTPHLPKAHTLRDDLQFLLERGENVANRLENLGTELKNKYVFSSAVAFDPSLEKNERVMELSPIPFEAPVEKEEFQEVERKGFFTSIRRVR